MDASPSSLQPHEEAARSDGASTAEIPAAARRQTGPSQRVQPVLYSSDLHTTVGPPLQDTPASHEAGDGDAVTVGFRRRGRNHQNAERMRAEALALVRSPLCWRPLVIFLFSVVVGVTLAMAAYCFRGRRVRGTAIFRGNDTS
ncbi:uncharacterized protein LOC144123280 [Amblyomma americanum]